MKAFLFQLFAFKLVEFKHKKHMFTKRLILIIPIIFAVQICFSQNLKCDSIYKPNKFHTDAKYKNGKGNFSETILNELHCKPYNDSIRMKMVTIVIDKKGKAHLYKTEGYSDYCVEQLETAIEKKMPKWIPATRENEKVCFELTFPVLFKE